MANLREFHGPNAGYVLDVYERYLRDPSSVDPGWRAYFQEVTPTVPAGVAASPASAGVEIPRVVGGRELARSIRSRGHTAARLDPLGTTAQPDPALRPEAYGMTEAELAQLPAAVANPPAAEPKEGGTEGAANAAEAIARLRAIYSGTIGYEFHHIPSAEERAWLRDALESGRFAAPLDGNRKRALLERLSQVEGFERYLHKAFFGQKRFSIEGTDMLVPMLDELIGEAGGVGAENVVIGMAHRGRLNVLTHVLGKSYEKMIAGFAGTAKGDPLPADPEASGPSGDVKYHMGWRVVREIGGRQVVVTLSPNPSHLEFVDPVVVGMTRAAQDRTDHSGPPPVDPRAALAVLVHGDAAFPGQGVVAETLNMSDLPGYTVGGTIHIIANNQVGFTTDPEQGRSTRYSSDLAKGFQIPIVHVNADDAEACLGVAQLAHAFRERFGKDFLIDLVGYRRWGHNEGDEPAFTQPRMYDTIRAHPTVREQYARMLVEQGVVEQSEADALLQAVLDRMGEAQAALGSGGEPGGAPQAPHRNGSDPTETAVAADRLIELNQALLERPERFTPNGRLEKLLERRRDAVGPDGGIDWGHAETLAFASLLAEGTPIRLSGQDAQRGTFSHRHLVLHDAEAGATFSPLASLPQARASFEVYNSPLSEMAVVGFEYGYTVFDPQVLVLWEAQFGDFVNGAQVIIDQFLAASYQKWEQRSGLVMLLPHGYEGQGPEHSSARLERFLQLAAEDNLRVAYCTTSAQYFHLLRRQAALLATDPRPLIVMSPKSLLRHPAASSRLEQLATGRFQPLLADPTEHPDRVTRLLLCSGKVAVDLRVGKAEQAEHIALARVEELYPFPAEAIEALIASLPALEEVFWVQEEPRNMGAWTFVQPRLRDLAGDRLKVRYVGRPERASPAEGSADRHTVEQTRIVAAAWGESPREAEKRLAHSAPESNVNAG